MDRKEENRKKKEYLSGYRKHNKRIKRIEAELEEIRLMKMNPSMNNDGMPHGSSQSDLSVYVSKLDELEEKLYQEGIARVKTYKEIEYKISEIESEDERDVLFYKYIKGKNFWEIAQLMDYSERWVKELHGRALKKVEIAKECTPLHL